MTDRADFKKPSRTEPRPFQVTLDFRSGLNLALAVALVQLTMTIAQIAVTYLFLRP